MAYELKDNQIRVTGEVTFHGERQSKNSDFVSTVIQIMQTEGLEQPEYVEAEIWGKVKDNTAGKFKVGDNVTATMWVNGSRKLWQDKAFTKLSLSFIEVNGTAYSAPEQPPNDDADDMDGLGDSEGLPF